MYDIWHTCVLCVNCFWYNLIIRAQSIKIPSNTKKECSKVNSLFCTVKAIYDRVICHKLSYHASKQGKIPKFKIDRTDILQRQSSKERKVPMFNLCETKKFQHRYLATNVISLYPISPCFKHGKFPCSEKFVNFRF